MTAPPPRRLAINRTSPAPVISQTRRVMTASENNAPARSQTAPGMERVRSEAREGAILWSLTDSPTSSAGERRSFFCSLVRALHSYRLEYLLGKETLRSCDAG